MKTIYKHTLNNVTNEVPTFEGAKFLHVANQGEQIAVWVEVNTRNRECVRTLYVIGTGYSLPEDIIYIGSALMSGGNFVFHVFEKE